MLRIFMAIVVAGWVAAGAAFAEEGESEAADRAASPVVVELFLSQACKSCPPAAVYLSELAERPDIIALSWHVDYWNLLSNRKYGRWSDPFSRADFAERQRRYNRTIRRRSTVFTPQAIISGDESAVGSKREIVEEMIASAMAEPRPALIRAERRGDEIQFVVSGETVKPCDALLVSFYKTAVTDVDGGDNAGVTFAEVNVVTGVTRLGAVAGGETTFIAPAPTDADKGCALLVQEEGQGRILGARYCP